MTRILLLIILCFLFARCSERIADSQDLFAEGIVDLAISYKGHRIIELPNLYDTLATGLPEKSDLILAAILKKKGFEQINSGRGNHSRGPRIVSKTYQKEDCVCEVSKLYYSTSHDNVYEMTERIVCMDKSEYEK